jgi:thioredoxin reductase (NADPH)
MTYVVTVDCIGCKFATCEKVCPVACFREGELMLVIDPDECIDCRVCAPECEAKAILPDTDSEAVRWLDLNAALPRVGRPSSRRRILCRRPSDFCTKRENMCGSSKPEGTMRHKTDAIVIGGGPCGLFAIFQLGINGLKAHVIDALDRAGGQCTELYPAKPIYDIPGFPQIDGQELTDRLLQQVSPFDPVFHFQQVAISLERFEENTWRVVTSTGAVIEAPVVVVASGGGSFIPKKPANVEGLEHFDGTSLHYAVRKPEIFAGKRIVIAGGGDSAVDWAIALEPIASKVILLHQREDLRAQPHSATRLNKLVEEGRVQRRTGRLSRLEGEASQLTHVVFSSTGGRHSEPADHLLVFFGLTMRPGPIETFGTEMQDGLIPVDTEKFESSLPGVFAIGDINVYPGKLKLILSGFHEAALMAKAAVKICKPDEESRFEYTTSSSRLQKLLRVA